MPIAKLSPDSVLQFSRVSKLHAWMRQGGVRFGKIGQSISCTEATARRLLTSDTAPSYRVHQLREAGIPEELLPAPLDIPPGPKPRNSAPATQN